jgi:integrase
VTTRALTPEEISVIVEALAAKGRHRDKLFIILLVLTGFRVPELLTITIGQLLTPKGDVANEISIARKCLKGGHGVHANGIRSRRVPLNARARTAIADYLVSLRVHPTSDTFVFQSRKGVNEHIGRCQAHHMLKAIAREAGLDASRLGCHSARKTFAKLVHAAGGNDLIKTQRLLGHASPMTTAKYLQTTDEELDTIVLGVDPMACRSGAATGMPAHFAVPSATRCV